MDIERQYDNAMSHTTSMLSGKQLPSRAPADNPYFGDHNMTYAADYGQYRMSNASDLMAGLGGQGNQSQA